MGGVFLDVIADSEELRAAGKTTSISLKDNVNKRITFLDIYLSHLQRSVSSHFVNRKNDSHFGPNVPLCLVSVCLFAING